MGEGPLSLERAAPALVVALGVSALGLAHGGFFSETWAPAVVAFGAMVEVALLLGGPIELSRLELAVLALFAAFVAWSALSAAWSAEPTTSLRDAERALLYAVALLAMLLATQRGFSGALPLGALAGSTFVSAYGLLEYLFARPPRNPAEGTALFEPLGYTNAAGMLAAIGIVLSVGLALDAPSPDWMAVLALPLVVLVPTLVLSGSQGAACSAIVVLVLLVASRLRHGRARVALPLAGFAVTAAIVIVSIGGSYGERVRDWRVALDEYRAHPVLGSGAGTYGAAWWKDPRNKRAVAAGAQPLPDSAHDLYLETFSEVGPLGVALLLAALALPLLALRGPPAARVAGAAYVALLLHVAIDWDWDMPAVTLAALAGAATLLAADREEHAVVSVSGRWRLATAATAGAVAISLLVVGAVA